MILIHIVLPDTSKCFSRVETKNYFCEEQLFFINYSRFCCLLSAKFKTYNEIFHIIPWVSKNTHIISLRMYNIVLGIPSCFIEIPVYR